MKKSKAVCKTELGRFLDLPPALEEEVVRSLQSSNGHLKMRRFRRSSDNMYGLWIGHQDLKGMFVELFPNDDPFSESKTTCMTRLTEDSEESIRDMNHALALAGHGNKVVVEGLDDFFSGLTDDDEGDFFSAIEDEDDFFSAFDEEEEEEDVAQPLSDFAPGNLVYDTETEDFYTIKSHNGRYSTLLLLNSNKVVRDRDKFQKRYLPAHLE